ncbi:MAG: leucine-rich repeat protein [Eggerthellaceae bacterium]|nr:leucine-rich repeat protein [Eggerthellaceae bacterium]
MNVIASTGKGRRTALSLLLAVVFALGLMSAAPLAYGAVPETTDYDGDTVKFFKADKAEEFNMWSDQGTEAGSYYYYESGKVRTKLVTSNKTVYGGFLLNASREDNEGTKPADVANQDNWYPVNSEGYPEFVLDESYCGKMVPVAILKTDDRGGGTTSYQTYLGIPAKDKLEDKSPIIYNLYVTTEELMWRVVKATLEDYPGDAQDYLTIYLNSATPTHTFSGTQKEAGLSFDNKDNDPRWGEKYMETISSTYMYNGTETSFENQSKAAYKVPVTIPENQTEFVLPLVSYSSDFAARRAEINLQDSTATFGNYIGSATVQASSEVVDVTVGSTGNISYKGYVRPYAGAESFEGTSNEWQSTLSLTITGGVYDKIYAVSDPAVEGAEEAAAAIAGDGAVELPVTNVYRPKTVAYDGAKVAVKMHVAEDAPYEEAGTWVDRTMGLEFSNVDAATVVFSGEALTPKTNPPVVLEDGLYKLPSMKSSNAKDGQMFNHMEADSRLLKVEGDTATIIFTQDGSTASVGKYSRVALVKSHDFIPSGSNYVSDDMLPAGTQVIDGVEQDKVADNARWRYDIELPKATVEEMLTNGTVLDVTVWNNTGSSADKIPGWYRATDDLWVELGTLGEATTTQPVTFVPQDAAGAAIAGATVTVTDSAGAEVAATDGKYVLTIGDTYTVAATADGYLPFTESYVAVAGETQEALALESSQWDVSCFTYSGATVTGLTDHGKNVLKANPAMVIPNEGPDGTPITAIGNGTSGKGTFGFTEDGEGEAFDRTYVPTSVMLPAGLEEIGNFAFSAALGTGDQPRPVKGLSEVTLPDTLKKIGNTAFQNAPLSSIVLPDSVEELGTGAFTGNEMYEHPDLEQLVISKNLKNIPQAAFLSRVVDTIVIPEGVETIGRNAFGGSLVKTLSLPNTLTLIDNQAFMNHYLASVEIPASVKTINQTAFRQTVGGYIMEANSIKTLVLNEGLETIGKNAFQDACALDTLAIPSTLTTLDSTAFAGNKNANRDDNKVVLTTEIEDQANAAGAYTKVVADGTGHIIQMPLEDLTITNNETPVWIQGNSDPEQNTFSAVVAGLGSGETISAAQWWYSKDGENWTKSGVAAVIDGDTVSMTVPEATAARKPGNMQWKVEVTTSMERTAEGAPLAYTAPEDLTLTNGEAPVWVKGEKDIPMTVKVSTLKEGETISKAVWYYSSNGTTWKKSGVAAAIDGDTVSITVPEATDARAPGKMSWMVKVTTSQGRTGDSEPQGFAAE